MSDNFFKIRKGLTLEPQSGPDPITGTNGDIYYNSTSGRFRKFENDVWSDLNTGGGASAAGFAQEFSVLSGDTFVDVIFPSTLSGTNYVVIPSFINTVDSDPQFQEINVSNKTTSGFRASWNAPTDSSNYKIAYVLPAIEEQVGEALVGSGVSNTTVTLPTALSTTNYVAVANLVNLVNGSPQFQPVSITAKTNSTFIASWNAPTEDDNYRLSFHVAVFQ